MGSNLNLLGEIECDASIMDGKSLNFGAVGALSGMLFLVCIVKLTTDLCAKINLVLFCYVSGEGWHYKILPCLINSFPLRGEGGIPTPWNAALCCCSVLSCYFTDNPLMQNDHVRKYSPTQLNLLRWLWRMNLYDMITSYEIAIIYLSIYILKKIKILAFKFHSLYICFCYLPLWGT